MTQPLNICFVHGRDEMEDHYRSRRHVVLSLRPEEAFFDLPRALEAADFKPDVIIQLERLGARTLLQGLAQFDCPQRLRCAFCVGGEQRDGESQTRATSAPAVNQPAPGWVSRLSG